MKDDSFLLLLEFQAALCVLAIAAVLYARLRELYRMRAALLCVRGDVKAYLKSADVVLSDRRAPQEIRKLVLMSLKTLSSPELAGSFVRFLGDRAAANALRDPDSPTEQALKALQKAHPELAAQAQEAAFGSLFCAAVLYADNIRIDVEREAAVRPDRLWARLGAMLAKLWPEAPTSLPRPYVSVL